jgi:hypothetical protein
MKQILPLNNNGSIQFKFQHEGQSYRFNPIKGGKFADKVTYDRACAIGHQISLDISIGHFDQTLEKYHLDTRQTSGKRSPVRAHLGKTDLLSLWDSWVTSLDLAPRTQADHYAMVRLFKTVDKKIRLSGHLLKT